jgi:hypothetical protein
MFLIFPYCTFKCDKENGTQICQNAALINEEEHDISIIDLIYRYLNNPLTHAVVCGGLEPFESFNDVYDLVVAFREKTNDDIVIYTGFYKFEIQKYVDKLADFPNIIIKFGRFIPNQQKHFDDILGIYLASDSQHAERISNENFST